MNRRKNLVQASGHNRLNIKLRQVLCNKIIHEIIIAENTLKEQKDSRVADLIRQKYLRMGLTESIKPWLKSL